ncbi:MAG: hypothetical protein ACRDX9_17245 [Acidimicrobiia bacterium]
MNPLFMIGMHGLGDNIYQRPFVRAEARRREVYLSTPWPELYEDLQVKFVRPARQYRTQTKNIDRQAEGRWAKTMPRHRDAQGFWYGLKGMDDNAVREFERQFAMDTPLRFDLPDTGPSPVGSRKPVAVIRPVTIRAEWRNRARNPDPRYVWLATRILKSRGWHTVSVADVDPPTETYLGDPPACDQEFNVGELTVGPLMALIRHAELVVGGVGWIVPAAIAAETPLIVIGGGLGSHNAPEKLTDPRMDLSRVRFILPSPYCRCESAAHDCPKRIPGFRAQFERAVEAINPARMAA